MASLVLVLGILSLVCRKVSALDYNYTGTITNTAEFTSSIYICNKTFDSANATGIFSLTPGLALGSTKQGNGTAFGAPIQWAVAGSQPSSGIQVSLHFSPGKANYLDNTQLGYDVCAIATDPGLINPNTYLRGQSDNGSSLQTYDVRCKAAIQELANNITKSANRPIAPNGSKQGANALPGICSNIATTISAAPPKECMPFYQNGASKWITSFAALTQSPNTRLSALSNACTTTAKDGSTFYNILTLMSSGYSDANYDILTTLPAPLITIFMPISSGEDTGKSIISEPYTEVSVLHITGTNPGSRNRLNLTAAGPVDYSSYDALMAGSNSTSNTTTSATANSSSGGISVGGIVGIVIAVVALILLAAAIAFFCVRRRRRARSKLDHPPNVSELDAGGYGISEKRMEVSGEGMHEMSPNSYKTSEMASPELPRHELPTGVAYGHEMDGSRPLVELPGDTPHKEKPK